MKLQKMTRVIATYLLCAITFTTIPIEYTVATASVESESVHAVARNYSAGAHSAINESVVLSDVTMDIRIYAMSEGQIADMDVPIVAKPSIYENIAIANVEDYASIYSEASLESEVLGKLYKNGAATVLETLNGWYQISSGTVTGFIQAEHVIVGEEEVCKAAEKKIATITTDSLRLRQEASEDAAVLTAVKRDMKVTVLDASTEGWLKVSYNNYTGYISSEYASVETVFDYAESKEEEAARKAAEEAARKAAEESARKAAEEAARQEELRKQLANKKYNPPNGTDGKAVVEYAVQYVGNPYVLGGSSLTGGIDCSNFVMRIYEAFGYTLPHNSYQLRSVGREVSASEMQAGDIVCYQGHVAIYMGDGRIVHASNPKGGIKITNKWNYTHVITIRRVLP